MSTIVDVIERVKTWPLERQADVARVIERMESSGTEIYQLSDDERLLVDDGLASATVSEKEMQKFWKRNRA